MRCWFFFFPSRLLWVHFPWNADHLSCLPDPSLEKWGDETCEQQHAKSLSLSRAQSGSTCKSVSAETRQWVRALSLLAWAALLAFLVPPSSQIVRTHGSCEDRRHWHHPASVTCATRCIFEENGVLLFLSPSSARAAVRGSLSCWALGQRALEQGSATLTAFLWNFWFQIHILFPFMWVQPAQSYRASW